MMDLRQYQVDVIDRVVGADERRIMLVAPTGSGKTVIAAKIIEENPNEHVLFLAHRRELIHQPRHTLAAFGVPAGIILAGEPRDPMRRVQVASIQTLHSRCMRRGQDLPPAGLAIDKSSPARGGSRPRRRETSRLTECSKCSAIRTAGAPCPNCGHMPRRPGEQVEYRDGDLHELDRNGGRRRPHHHGPEERHEFHRMLVGYAVARGYKVGWAAYKFREKFGDWPDARNVAPLDPSREVMSWVRSRNIAFAKSQDRRAS